jgi:beta-aspartyl-dipeptidase (metallo-type)
MFTVIRGGHVHAPEALGPCDILVAGTRIAAIGRDVGPPRGAACEEVDAAGATVVPGLVDPHVHATGGGGECGFASRVAPITAETLSLAGITTSVGVLGTDTTTRDVESLVAATMGLREAGLSAWCWTGGYAVPPRTLTGSVRRDIVFVEPIVGVGETAVSDHRSSQPSLDEILRLAADCHVAGLTSGKAGVLHLHVGDGRRGLELVRRALDSSELPPRVFYPTHVNRQPRLFEEAMALAERGVTVDVTAFPRDDADPAIDAADAIERFLAAGLPRGRLTCSSDGAGSLPVFDAQGEMVRMDVASPATLLGTIRALRARGRQLDEVLPVFTSNAAELLRLVRKGRLAPGADADILLLGADLTVDGVLSRGRWMVRGGKATGGKRPKEKRR